jgi:hypothetical protein
VGPDEELSDEAPELADEASGAPEAVEESGVEFAAGADVAMAGEAPDTDEYAMDESAPKADLSNELADDAGDSASYGFEAARETARFEGANDSDPDLAEASGVADDSDKYRIMPGTDDGPAPSFAEESANAVDQDAAYDPEPAAEEESAYASHFDGVDSDETSAPEAAPEADSGEAPAVADEAPPQLEPEPEPVRRAAPPSKPAAKPAPAPAPEPAAAGGVDDRPGQVRRSAIDEMFARAAELKNKKKKP